MRFVLGPWIWDTAEPDEPHWRAPEGCAGLLDLRSIPHQSIAGGSPEGFGLFALRNSAPNPGRDYRLLGTALDDAISPSARALIGSQLRVGSLESNRLNLLLYELLTMKGDHTGLTFARPLMPRTDAAMNIGLAGVRVHRERFNHEAIQHAATLRQLRAQFREERRASLNGERFYRGVPDLLHHRRQLSRRVKELRGIAWEHLVDPEFRTPQNAPEPERTIITDDFNRADNEDPGADWTEVDGDFEILNNKLQCNATAGDVATLRHDGTDLSSSNHYSQILFSTQGAGTAWCSGMVRFQPSAETAYWSVLRQNGSISQISKIITGTATSLVDGSGGAPPPHTDKLEINGSDLELFRDAVSKETVTDTSIASGTRVGVTGHPVTQSSGDDFEAADLAAAGAVLDERRYPRGVMRGVLRGVA